MKWLSRFRTYLDLGVSNLSRVAFYKIGLKSGWLPVQKISAVVPSGRYFSKIPATSDPKLLARETWRKDSAFYFGQRYPLASDPPNWHASAFAPEKIANAKIPWWKIPDFDPAVGDIKGVWEASRFDWLLAMAQRATNGYTFELERLNSWITDWAAKNPPYLGANWKCGQEASIRVIHLALAALLLKQIGKPQQALLDLIYLHLQRISPTTGYAIGQANNHGTSEGAALFIGGTWLQACGRQEGVKFARQGRSMLQERVGTLISDDGSFSQYSVNYHRVLLDTCNFAEVWRRQLDLAPFSYQFLESLGRATNWLYSMVITENGHAPNIGANDGSKLICLCDTDYRDFRPTLQISAALFLQKSAYADFGPWNTAMKWLGIEPAKQKLDPPKSASFDDFGIHVLRCNDTVVYFRYPRFKFRPRQSDALHLDIWHKGKNIAADSGSYCYNGSPEDTKYFGSVKAHNTIEFDNRDQMPKLSRFLYGDWVKSTNVFFTQFSDGSLSAQAAYKDKWGASHCRMITLNSKKLDCLDIISNFEESAVLRWRLRPSEWNLDGSKISNEMTDLEIESSDPETDISLNKGQFSLYYMKKRELPVLEVKLSTDSKITTTISFSNRETLNNGL